jgi:hypothetical protein
MSAHSWQGRQLLPDNQPHSPSSARTPTSSPRWHTASRQARGGRAQDGEHPRRRSSTSGAAAAWPNNGSHTLSVRHAQHAGISDVALQLLARRAVHLAAAGTNRHSRDGVDAPAGAAPADAASARLLLRSRCAAVFLAPLFCAVCATRPAHRCALTLQQPVQGRAVSLACTSRTRQAHRMDRGSP